MTDAHTAALEVLHSRVQEIRSLNVENQAINFAQDEWIKWFDGTYFEAVEGVTEALSAIPGPIKRKHLFELAAIAAESHYAPTEVTKLWVAAYAWGGGVGAMGYRARVNARMALFDRRFPDAIKKTIEALSKADICGAHETIDQVVGSGEAFFTKFFYFVCKPGLCDPLPLIYDEQVRRSLRSLLGTRWALPLGATMATSPAELYDLYVRTMHEWSGEVGCSPEQLELYFFTSRGTFDASTNTY